MNRARELQGDNDPRGKRGKPNTAQVAILAGIAAGTVIALVGAFLWAPMWTAVGVVFVASALLFTIPVVIFAKSHGGSTPH
jgi:hypothetical protein